VLTKRDFKELFRYEENDRDKKALKKDWKRLDKQFKSELKFRHIIDFYLGSSDQLASCMFDISAKKLLDSLDVGSAEGFNESIMRVLCLNQAIAKMSKELRMLCDVRETILHSLEQMQISDKLG